MATDAGDDRVAQLRARGATGRIALGLASIAIGLFLGFLVWAAVVFPGAEYGYESSWGRRAMECQSRRGLDALFPVFHPYFEQGPCRAIVPTAAGWMAILAAVALPMVLTAIAVAYWPGRRVAQGMAIVVTALALGLFLGLVVWGFAISPSLDAYPYEATWGQRLVPCESRRGLDALFPVLHGPEGSPFIGSGCTAVVPTAVASTAILVAIALPIAVVCTAIWRWSRRQMPKGDDGPTSRPQPRTPSTS